MEDIVKNGEDIVYRQTDGEVTANLTDFKEKMVLEHQGSSRYQNIFYLLVAAGVIYLFLIFMFF
jgi:hypothetical protein